MTRLYLLIILAVFFLSGCSTALKDQRASVISGPVKIETEQYTWDFGQIKQNEILKHEFILKNETSLTLNLKDATSSCGCTVLALKKKVLLPTESTAIEVKFDSRGYLGPIQQFVYLSTDSKDIPVIRFIIKANVIKNKEV